MNFLIKKKRFSLIFLLMFFIPFISIYESAGEKIELPIIDHINLFVDGSGAGGINVSNDLSFSVISRIIYHLEFAIVAFGVSDFGSQSGPLTNGIDLRMNFSNSEMSLLDNDVIKENDDFAHDSYDFNLISDDQNPKERMLTSRLSFNKFSPVGIDNRTGLLTEFFFWIRDDITATATNFTVAIEGYRNINIKHFINDQDIWFNGALNFVEMEDLIINNNYALKFLYNNSLVKWRNFTAINDDMKMEIVLDLKYTTDSSLLVELYKSNVLIDSSTRTYKASNVVLPQGIVDTIILIAQYFALFIAGMILFSLFTRRGKKW